MPKSQPKPQPEAEEEVEVDVILCGDFTINTVQKFKTKLKLGAASAGPAKEGE